MPLAKTLTTSSACLLASSLLFGCTGVPDTKRVEPESDQAEVAAVAKSDPVEISDTDLPHKSAVCAPEQFELDGECITDKKAMAVIEQVSDLAVEQMIQVHDDPEAQIEAQHTLTKIQDYRIEQAVEDTAQIKQIIRDKKKAGELPKYPKNAFDDWDGKNDFDGEPPALAAPI